MKMIRPIVAFLFVFALVFSVQAQDCDEGFWYCGECGECIPQGDEQSHHVDAHGGTYTEAELESHHHCGICDAAFDSSEEMDQHHEDAHAQAEGDHPPPGECHCGHVFTENDQHGHCPACDEALDGDADWQDHCSSNPDHCGPPPGGEEGHHDDPSFGDVDTDGDGDISEEEAQAAFGEDPNWLEEFERHDTNDDGVVTEDEFYGCAPDEAFDANCGAICAGMDTYVLDTDDDCIADSDPYATWDEPLCKCPEDDDGH